MRATDLTQYMASALELELNLYVQKETLARVRKMYGALGHPKCFQKPALQKAESNLVGMMLLVGGIGILVVGLIAAIIEWIVSKGFFMTLFNVLAGGILYGVLGGVLCGIVFGPIVNAVLVSSEQRRLDLVYQTDTRIYDQRIKHDRIRLQQEETQKVVLQRDIEQLEQRINESTDILETLYACNILNPDYRNIYAVSSIYEYLMKGRTRCLAFNARTGDQGAYNLYEQERRMDRIITNTEEILNRLDIVINNQYVLAEGLKRAQDQIQTLCLDVNRHMQDVTKRLGDIQVCEELAAYHAEQTSKEVALIGWMHAIGY